MYKAVISVGNLSFSTGVPADSQAKTSVSVLDTENKISVSISPASSGEGEVLPQKTGSIPLCVLGVYVARQLRMSLGITPTYQPAMPVLVSW